MSPRPSRLSPAELCGSWPDNRCDDPVAEFARRFALNLRAAIGTASVREVARQSGVDRTVIGLILSGASWPDMVTTVRLELALGRLWPTVDDMTNGPQGAGVDLPQDFAEDGHT